MIEVESNANKCTVLLIEKQLKGFDIKMGTAIANSLVPASMSGFQPQTSEAQTSNTSEILKMETAIANSLYTASMPGFQPQTSEA